MPIDHACFISFPRGPGKDTQFAAHFYEELVAQLAAYGNLSVFKYDRCEDRRQGDTWSGWIQRELCSSAMMFAVCAPNYFVGSPGCVSEFRGMERLILERTKALGEPTKQWLVALRLKDKVPMPALQPYYVYDFLECLASPEKVRRVHRLRAIVETLADRVYEHWQWLQTDERLHRLEAASVCRTFTLPEPDLPQRVEFPFAGGIR